MCHTHHVASVLVWTGYKSNHHPKGRSKLQTLGIHSEISQEGPQPREWHHQNGNIGGTRLCPTTKINMNKNSSGRSLEPTYKLQQHSPTKKSKNSHIQKWRKTDSFCLHHPIPQASTTQPQEKTPQLERVPLARKVECGKGPASQPSLHKDL